MCVRSEGEMSGGNVGRTAGVCVTLGLGCIVGDWVGVVLGVGFAEGVGVTVGVVSKPTKSFSSPPNPPRT